MASSIKPYILVCIGALLLLNNSNICHAGYEVYSAKTIHSSAAKTSLDKPDPVPDDLFQMDDETGFGSETNKKDENTILGKLFENIKRRRIAKKIKDNPIPDEDDPDMANISAQNEETPVDEKNKFQIKADKISYDDADGNVYAKGHVSVFSKAQGITVKSDNAVLDKNNQTIQFLDNVRVIKDGVEMRGQSLFVDLNEENILMDDPTVDAYSFTVRAQQAFFVENDIQMTNGVVKNNNDILIPFVSQGFQILNPFGPMSLYDYTIEKKEDAFKNRPTYSIKAKEMVITNYKDHDAVNLNKSDIFYGKHKVIRGADIEFYTDKDRQIVEANVPEVGSLSDFGTYFGYGFIKKLWGGQSIKLMPALVYHSGPGIGIIGRHQSRNNSMEAGWATAKSNFVLRGKYKLGKKTTLHYGVNSYMDEGFLGARRPRYGVQLRNERMFYNKDLDLSYKQGIYGGFYTDYFKQQGGGYYSTSRFRYLGQLCKSIKRYQNKEQDLYIGLDAVVQGGVTQYGSGETTGVIRVGPYLRTKVKKWESNIGYLLGGVHGDSPFFFDKYMYGKSSIILNEKFNFNNAFALGYLAVLSPLRDNYQNDLLTESRLYAMAGPKDIKLAISYDFVRSIAHFDFLFLLGLDKTKITFEQLKTKGLDGSKNKRDFYRRSQTISKMKQEENI